MTFSDAETDSKPIIINIYYYYYYFIYTILPSYSVLTGDYLSEEKPGHSERILSQDRLRSRGKSVSCRSLGNFWNNAGNCLVVNTLTGAEPFVLDER